MKKIPMRNVHSCILVNKTKQESKMTLDAYTVYSLCKDFTIDFKLHLSLERVVFLSSPASAFYQHGLYCPELRNLSVILEAWKIASGDKADESNNLWGSALEEGWMWYVWSKSVHLILVLWQLYNANRIQKMKNYFSFTHPQVQTTLDPTVFYYVNKKQTFFHKINSYRFGTTWGLGLERESMQVERYLKTLGYC